MTRSFFPLSLIVMVSWHPPAFAQTTWSCGYGTVRGIEAIDEAITRATIATDRGDSGRVETLVARTDTEHRRSYVLAVQLGQVLYTSESAGDPSGTLDPLRLVAGDRIQTCVSATQMIVERPDGTDYRAPLVGQAPAPLPVSMKCRKSRKSSSTACR